MFDTPLESSFRDQKSLLMCQVIFVKSLEIFFEIFYVFTILTLKIWAIRIVFVKYQFLHLFLNFHLVGHKNWNTWFTSFYVKIPGNQ